MKNVAHKNNKQREAALENEVGGDEKYLFFLYLALIKMIPHNIRAIMAKIKLPEKPLSMVIF